MAAAIAEAGRMIRAETMMPVVVVRNTMAAHSSGSFPGARPWRISCRNQPMTTAPAERLSVTPANSSRSRSPALQMTMRPSAVCASEPRVGATPQRGGSLCLCYCGERDGTRTHDPLIKSQMLYRLSYALAGISLRAAGRARAVRRHPAARPLPVGEGPVNPGSSGSLFRPSISHRARRARTRSPRRSSSRQP